MRTYEELSNEFWDDDKLLDFDNVKSEYYDKYLNELNEIIANDSSNIDALNLKCFILNCQNKFEEGLEVCDVILKKVPYDIKVLNNKADNLFHLCRYRECVELCQRILELDPKNKDAIDSWRSSCLMSDNDKLPKPPESLLKKCIKIILILLIFVSIIYYLLYPSITGSLF